MEIYKAFRIGPIYVYVSTRRMKRRSQNEVLTHNHRAKLRRMKRRLYADRGGRCECCGEWYPPEELELHHIVGVTAAPHLVTSWSNLQLLCKECHQKVHGRPSGEPSGTVTAQ